MKRNLEEHISRMKELSLIKEADEINVGGGAEDEVIEDKLDVVLASTEFKRQLEGGIRMMARDLPNQLNLISKRTGEKNGTIETKPKTKTNRGLSSMDYKTAILPTKMAELLGIALRKSGTEFDLQTLRDAGNILSKIGRELYRTFFKTIYLGIKPITTNINDDERKELAEKILIASILIASVWYIQATIGNIKSDTNGGAENESENLFKAIKINLPRWIQSITSFEIY
jgi:hypothetical protein